MESYPEDFSHKSILIMLRNKGSETQIRLLKESRQTFYEKLMNDVSNNKNGHLSFCMKLNDELLCENKKIFLDELRERFHRLECGVRNEMQLYDDIRDDLSSVSSIHTIYLKF